MTIQSPTTSPTRTPHLTLWDAVSIIIGIVVGTSIFRSPPIIFKNVPNPAWAMTLWVVGGLVSWWGAVCYAELATTYPPTAATMNTCSRAPGPLVRIPLRLGPAPR